MNLHLYPAPFRYESRILRITKSLVAARFFQSIEIVAMGDGTQKEFEILEDGRTIWRGKAQRLIGWFIRILRRYYGKKIEAINCHSLSTLPIGVFFKMWKGSRLIYDTHELETEKSGLKGLKKLFAKIIEKICIPFVDAIVTVSDLIGNWYQTRYPLKPIHVIRNMPEISKTTRPTTESLRLKLGINAKDLVFLYLGLLAPGRGVELILDAFSQLPRERHAVFLGFGELEDRVKWFAEQHSNIHFHPAVENKWLPDYVREADVGLALIEDRCLSYRYCLPNKFFEYLAGGRPIIISDLPEMAHLLDEQEAGWKVSFDERSLRDLVNRLVPKEIEVFKERLEKKRPFFAWHREEKKLMDVYKKWFKYDETFDGF